MIGQEKIDRFCSEITRCFYAPQNKQEPNIMAFEQRDNSGSVWVNDRKTADNHPDRTGSAKINGEDFWVHGWLKKTKDGKPYLSLAFKKKSEQPAASEKKSPAEDLDDRIPF
jgi:hypothetical protein